MTTCVDARQDENPLPPDMVPALHGMPLLELELLRTVDKGTGNSMCYLLM